MGAASPRAKSSGDVIVGFSASCDVYSRKGHVHRHNVDTFTAQQSFRRPEERLRIRANGRHQLFPSNGIPAGKLNEGIVAGGDGDTLPKPIQAGPYECDATGVSASPRGIDAKY